ncbi:FAS1-like dehydratase domain-containing protein [Micromonospora sp. DT178]|uniref:MaoC family dehydratase N-terminal domain-containing protein n=1 Tax=unclassified Micromonospora TaxID=2617518 RepID=UPI00124B09F0|nr:MULTISPECIES: MaoC family dehydratase N-terminal domain-containing protein [unclassified Micromonospora]KAB1161108.1 MaoC family dehydratase [Micromonospora sp. AMSO12t]WSG02741.1 MaoC family dehydratase N-terminal domain-containing protein [Micromonospora sp. NBC_01740]
MSLDPSFVGRTYPPTAPYQVGREKIREFATAIGAADPAHHDPEAARALGHPDVVAPPTFPIVLTMAANQQIIDDPALGVDYSRVVHGDQRFAYARPVVAGDELVCVSVIDDVSSRGGHGFLTTRTEVATPAGEPVVTVWSKLVVRGEG